MDEQDEDFAIPRCSKRRRLVLDHVQPSQLVFPKSQYEGWVPPDDPVPELVAVWTLEEEKLRQAVDEKIPSPMAPDENDCKIFALSEFSIYRKNRRSSPNELVPLHQLKVAYGDENLFFDGVLSFGNVRKYVQHVQFSTVTVEGYGDNHQLSEICIQSAAGAISDVWYSLKKPAAEYQRYHDAFLWIAEFAKHFVDYLCSHASVHLVDLREIFYKWLHFRYNPELMPSQWLSKYGRKDFRQAFIAYSDFLWKESCSIRGDTRRHPIWVEADPKQLCAIKREPAVEAKTIVTPYAYDCFKHMYFAHCLRRVQPFELKIILAYEKRKITMGFTVLNESTTCLANEERAQKHSLVGQIKIGSVIAVGRDEKSAWKDKSSTWYAYVQGITVNGYYRQQLQVLNVIWLYRPEDTTLSKGTYPWNNELFFSDNCNCGNANILVSDVLRTVHVEWFGRNPATTAEFFVRQSFVTNDGAYSFRDLQASDFTCTCRHKKSAFTKVYEKFKVGDTVLIKKKRSLEPCILVNFRHRDEEVSIRRLERLHGKVSSARPNELGWTEQITTMKPSRIVRKCHIRIYPGGERKGARIPPPYNRDGTADCWFISGKVSKKDGDSDVFEDLKPGTDLTFNKGFDPLKPDRPPLRGLDLFCGGGSFGRGLEESGAVDMKYALDHNEQAIHTWRANKTSKGGKAFLGDASANLFMALAGVVEAKVARIGDLEEISSGSPCQGWCNAQPDKQSDASKRNSSMVALVIAFFDWYRPLYGILENVPLMAKDIGGQNVFAQVLCALVGMGYQTQQFLLDACSCGDGQKRSRLFVVVAAPGLEPFNHPSLTHAYVEGVRPAKLGLAVNGLPFGERRFESAYSFDAVTARSATEDLPHIGDSQLQVCIPYPDHRIPRVENVLGRCQIVMIPTSPYGTNFLEAHRMGYIATPQVIKYAKYIEDRKGRYRDCWRRMIPNEPFPTVITRPSPRDMKGSPCIHWNQHRMITIMEARRAQGIPDDEVLVGLPAAQFKLVGNGVSRGVSLALGMAMRESWLASSRED